MGTNAKSKYAVTNLKIHNLDGVENTVYARWNAFNNSKHNSHFDKYEVIWRYNTGQGVWFEGSTSSISERTTGGALYQTSQYSLPANALKVKVTVKVVSKYKTKSNGQQTKELWFNGGTTSSDPFDTPGHPKLAVPETPTVTIENNKLTATIDNYDNTGNLSTPEKIQFEIVKDDVMIYGAIQSANLIVSTGHAGIADIKVEDSAKYKVRARAVGRVGKANNVESDWSSYSSNVDSSLGQVSAAPAVEALTPSSVSLTWPAVTGAFNYEIQYVKDSEEYFVTNPSAIQSSKPDGRNTETKRIITDLDNSGGVTYYFRVRACGENDDQNGQWSASGMGIAGTKPEPPTTWTYTSAVKQKEDVILNWIHNSEDGSTQKAAKIKITINGVSNVIEIPDETSSYTFPTDDLADSTKVKWAVSTKGAVAEYSDYSTEREFTVYEPPIITRGIYDDFDWFWNYLDFDTGSIYNTPGLGESFTSNITSFPFELYAIVTPLTQNAVSMFVTITANSGYEIVDETGVQRQIFAGDEVFSSYFSPVDNEIFKVFEPFDLDLESGVEYTITISAAMGSGLEATVSDTFTVSWEDVMYNPNAEYVIDESNYACYIRPFVLADEDGEEEEYFNAWLSVYRREYDGRFTEIASRLDANQMLTVTDPHPSLDYARYRIVAVDRSTGAITYEDISPIPVGGNEIIIQWNENWIGYTNEYADAPDPLNAPQQGSILRLPYNIDVSVDNKPDVALVEYIGRSDPVSYYGTQRGETTRWTTDIPKSDYETLFQIRRLAAYMGDVYVREPSGLGYWANITVSYNIQHTKPVIPVTFRITRVNGGM